MFLAQAKEWTYTEYVHSTRPTLSMLLGIGKNAGSGKKAHAHRSERYRPESPKPRSPGKTPSDLGVRSMPEPTHGVNRCVPDGQSPSRTNRQKCRRCWRTIRLCFHRGSRSRNPSWAPTSSGCPRKPAGPWPDVRCGRLAPAPLGHGHPGRASRERRSGARNPRCRDHASCGRRRRSLRRGARHG